MARPWRPASQDLQSGGSSVSSSCEAGIEVEEDDTAPIFSLSKSSMDVLMQPPCKLDLARATLDLKRSSSTSTHTHRNTLTLQELHACTPQRATTTNNRPAPDTGQQAQIHGSLPVSKHRPPNVERWSMYGATSTGVYGGGACGGGSASEIPRPWSLSQVAPPSSAPDSPVSKVASPPTTPSPFVSPLQTPPASPSDTYWPSPPLLPPPPPPPSPPPPYTHQQEEACMPSPAPSPLSTPLSPESPQIPEAAETEDECFLQMDVTSSPLSAPCPATLTSPSAGLEERGSPPGISPEIGGLVAVATCEEDRPALSLDSGSTLPLGSWEGGPEHAQVLLSPPPVFQVEREFFCQLELPPAGSSVCRGQRSPLVSSLSDSLLDSYYRCSANHSRIKLVNLIASPRATGGRMFREEGTMTSEQGTMTSEQGTMTLEQGTMTSEEGTMTSEKGTMMSEEGTMMSEEGTMMSEKGTMMSEEGTMTLEEGTMMSEKGTMMSEKGTMMSEEGTMTLEEGTITSEEGTMMSEEGTMTLEEGTMTSEEGTMTSQLELVDTSVQTVSPPSSWWNFRRHLSQISYSQASSHASSHSILGSPPGSRLNLRESAGSSSNLVSSSSSMYPVDNPGQETGQEGGQEGDPVWEVSSPPLYHGERRRSCLKIQEKEELGRRCSMKQVQWDEAGMTWDVYGASLDPLELSTAILRHLNLKTGKGKDNPSPQEKKKKTKNKKATKAADTPSTATTAKVIAQEPSSPKMVDTATSMAEGKNEVSSEAEGKGELEEEGDREGMREEDSCNSKAKGEMEKEEDVEEVEEEEVYGEQGTLRRKSSSRGSGRGRSVMRSLKRPGWCGSSSKANN